ncbi:hypothetical protein PR001_g2996 [Phytophthora rubi]|uniref:Uncharacterized protein n=1 Tax=Phytophthora rubi TaxID=129364 RepID=A0A6A3NHX8_9STRA|nr:hypothetical protein PR002_g2401 [Phytophthora rubi]KAE9049764.1 hypothetical protein PR001_g2996 [Phytophthora rubi]
MFGFYEAAWFRASGDLIFAQWLLDRCADLSDVATPQSLEVCQRVQSWFRIRQRLREELGVTSTEADRDETCRHPLWAIRPPTMDVGEIVGYVGEELRALQREMAQSDSRSYGILERATMVELVETTTELLISRATRDDETDLYQWTELLEGQWLWKGQARDAAMTACEQVAAFVELLVEAPPSDGREAVDVLTVEPDAEWLWALEMQQMLKMNAREEANRRGVAKDIENMRMWPGCRVEVFGSSLSLYGSPDSDVDMSLMTNGPRRGKDLPPELLGFYYLKRLLERKVWDEEQKGTVILPNVEQLKRVRSQARDGAVGLYTSKDPKQRQNAVFFELQMELLAEAASSEINDIYRRERMNRGHNATSRAQDKLWDSKHRKNELFDLKSLLEGEPECKIKAVASHARVPVIRFQYTLGDLDYKCDLCFDNELGLRNTRLLRAYASYDDRARDLGLAVKHWAKQRGISDTASGFLSSYSYVLLSIYYLQVVRVLPNLQDPRLLELAGVSAEYYDGVNIAFCEDRDLATVFHEQNSGDRDSQDASISELLMGFFEFYATQFDYVKHAIAIRTPERSVPKQSLWGTKAKSWRMSIQDPLQTSRDLCGMLHFSGQRKIADEMRRAHALLARWGSFLDMVC